MPDQEVLNTYVSATVQTTMQLPFLCLILPYVVFVHLEQERAV